MSTAVQRRRASRLSKIIFGAAIVIAVIIGLLYWMAYSRAQHPAAGACPDASVEWKQAAIARHLARSNLPDFNDGKDIALTGGDRWNEHDQSWSVPFATGHGQHHFTAIITCDGVTELSAR
jgi:hypothetical protein